MVQLADAFGESDMPGIGKQSLPAWIGDEMNLEFPQRRGLVSAGGLVGAEVGDQSLPLGQCKGCLQHNYGLRFPEELRIPAKSGGRLVEAALRCVRTGQAITIDERKRNGGAFAVGRDFAEGDVREHRPAEGSFCQIVGVGQDGELERGEGREAGRWAQGHMVVGMN